MLTGTIKIMLAKSISNDLVKMAIKSSRRGEDVLKEKLGVSSIDEFMKMDIRK